jgi:hypothetical protein
MIRKLFIAAGVATLAFVAVGSLASARMASMQLTTTEGRGAARADEPGLGRVSGARTIESPRWPLASLASAAHVEGISEGNLVRALEDARRPQPGRMPKIALGK